MTSKTIVTKCILLLFAIRYQWRSDGFYYYELRQYIYVCVFAVSTSKQKSKTCSKAYCWKVWYARMREFIIYKRDGYDP